MPYTAIMDSSKKLSSIFIFLIYIFFCFLSMSPQPTSSDVLSEFLKVALPIFKNLLESTINIFQNMTSTKMSHLDIKDCFYHSNDFSDGCMELLCSTTQLLNWSLSIIHNPQGLYCLYTFLGSYQFLCIMVDFFFQCFFFLFFFPQCLIILKLCNT